MSPFRMNGFICSSKEKDSRLKEKQNLLARFTDIYIYATVWAFVRVCVFFSSSLFFFFFYLCLILLSDKYHMNNLLIYTDIDMYMHHMQIYSSVVYFNSTCHHNFESTQILFYQIRCSSFIILKISAHSLQIFPRPFFIHIFLYNTGIELSQPHICISNFD